MSGTELVNCKDALCPDCTFQNLHAQICLSLYFNTTDSVLQTGWQVMTDGVNT